MAKLVYAITVSWSLIAALVVTPQAMAQNLTNCELTDVLNEAEDLLWNLQEYIAILGEPETESWMRQAIINEDARRVFASEALVRADLDPSPTRPGIIERSTRLDAYDTYLKNIGLFYRKLDVWFSDMQVVAASHGRRFSFVGESAGFRLAFNRGLTGVDTNGDQYEDAVPRVAVFRVVEEGAKWRPRIVTLEFANHDPGVAAESGKMVEEIRQKCAEERRELDELRQAQWRAEQEEEARLAALVEEMAAIEQQIAESRRRQAEEEEAALLRASEAAADVAEEAISTTQEDVEKQEREEQEAHRRLAELEQQRAREETRIREEQALRNQTISVQEIRFRQRKERQRILAPGATIGLHGFRTSDPALAAMVGEFWGGAALGLDLGYGKFEIGLANPSGEWDGVLALDNGVFPVEQDLIADSVYAIFGSAQGGYPLYLGGGLSLYLGAGVQVMSFEFARSGTDGSSERFLDYAPIVEATFGYFALSSGTGFKVSYRKSFSARYVNWDGVNVSLQYKLNVPK